MVTCVDNSDVDSKPCQIEKERRRMGHTVFTATEGGKVVAIGTRAKERRKINGIRARRRTYPYLC
jgi:hypothetical protein